MSFGNGLVQRPDTIDPDNGAPVGIFRESCRNLGLRLDRDYFREIALRRELQTEAFSERKKVEHFQITGRRE